MVEELKSEEVTGIDELPIVDSMPPIDTVKYKGIKMKIENVTIDKEAINWYNGAAGADGRPTFNPNSTEKMWKVVVETYPVPELDKDGNVTDKLVVIGENEDKTPKHVRVIARFNLTNKEDKWVISKAPQAKLWKFMRKQGAAKLSELKNTIVIIDTHTLRDLEIDYQ